MNRKFLLLSPGVMICCVATALGQAGAPTQRVHIPGIPDGTSIYPKSANIGDNFLSIGCVTKNPEGEIVITDWRGSEQPSIAGAPPLMLALKRLQIVGSVVGTLKDVEEALDFTARGLVHVR